MIADSASATGEFGARTFGGDNVKNTSADLRRLGTNDVSERDRPNEWQRFVGEPIGAFELHDYENGDVGPNSGLTTVGDIKIRHLKGGRETSKRAPELGRSNVPDVFYDDLEPSSTGGCEPNGRESSSRCGMVLVDIARPHQGNHPDDLDVIDVFIPRPVMERALGLACQAAGLSIDASQPSFPVVAAFLHSLSLHGASLEAASAARMSAIAVDLIASCVVEGLGSRPMQRTSGRAILSRAQAYIADNLGVSGLGMQDVAATLNISIRKLHQIAAEEGVSLVDWMWERRLSRAHAMLSDPASHSRLIGAIAFECGFVDQAHFSRRFKLRYGHAPSELRAALHPTLVAPWESPAL